ncbi:Phosphatidylinositolglycan class N-domain-containing protein, partial [Chytridium lagenaria]
MGEEAAAGGIRGAVANLLILGVVFHIIYSWSIFDIYFRSPLVHGMTPVEPPQPAPAKRIGVVSDGLRADKLFENRMALSPYLKDVVLSKGSWGVSHTRVPTESRPGHVALIAGFYEDVSAVTQGWKTNPVEFDSLFNESRKTWSFGSPDILPMFAEGASDKNRVDMFMYPAESEDFAEEDASKLDTWVFDKVDELLVNATTDKSLYSLLHEDKVVIFLHLLGLDTNGHAHRPYSKEYLENIKLVDNGIKTFVDRIEKFYNDGENSLQNTETPIIVWGAGVAGPNKTHPTGHKEQWSLEDLQRSDVNQADIAPLMSTLIGVTYPMNSVGVLPLAYLSNTDEYKAKAAYGNAKQILQQYLVKEDSKRRTELSFVPFHPLLNHSDRLAESKSMEMVMLCIDGLRYYQTYDWLFLRSIISAGLLFMVKTYGGLKVQKSSNAGSQRFVNGVALLSPPNYYLYIIFLVYLWAEAAKIRAYGVAALRHGLQNGGCGLSQRVYSYFRRDILTPCLVVGGLIWPFLLDSEFRKQNRSIVLWWRVFCVLTSIFTVLRIYGGAVVFVSGLGKKLTGKGQPPNIILLQLLIILISMIMFTILHQIVSWLILASCVGIPALDTAKEGHHFLRRIVIFISYEALFYAVFSLLLISWLVLERRIYSYSAAFPLSNDYQDVTKKREGSSSYRPLVSDDLRIAVFFLLFCNIASVSSFSLESVYRFTTVFNPFLMAALLIMKIWVPFFLLSAIFGVLSRSLELPAFSLFLMVLSTTDVMTLNFFFLVRDDGIVLFSVGHFLVGKVLIPNIKKSSKRL